VHKDSLTALITLKDGHTIISAGLDKKIVIWDAADNKQPIKELEEHTGSVNYLYMMNNLGNFVSCGSDHKIIIWKVEYGCNTKYNRTTLIDCVKENMLTDECEVNTVNESYFDKNILITGGSDNKVKVWSLTSNSIVKVIECHSSEVVGSIIIENPFLKENNSCI